MNKADMDTATTDTSTIEALAEMMEAWKAGYRPVDSKNPLVWKKLDNPVYIEGERRFEEAS